MTANAANGWSAGAVVPPGWLPANDDLARQPLFVQLRSRARVQVLKEKLRQVDDEDVAGFKCDRQRLARFWPHNRRARPRHGHLLSNLPSTLQVRTGRRCHGPHLQLVVREKEVIGANGPANGWYIDSLPILVFAGRGAPIGVPPPVLPFMLLHKPHDRVNTLVSPTPFAATFAATFAANGWPTRPTSTSLTENLWQ